MPKCSHNNKNRTMLQKIKCIWLFEKHNYICKEAFLRKTSKAKTFNQL